MELELVDTHCHLSFEPLRSQIDGVLERARMANVTRVVAPAYDAASWAALAELRATSGVAIALGLHPWVADQPLDLAHLEEQVTALGAVAVGEIGLDFAVPGADRPRQARLLAGQLDLARRLDLPVILHCRRAFDPLMELLRAYPVRGVLHAFSRGPELAHRLSEGLDLHLAFGGAVTRPNARRAREAAATLKAGRLLLETDAPSIGLEGVAPEETEPRHVARVAAAVAELRGETLETLAEQTTENARALFSLS